MTQLDVLTDLPQPDDDDLAQEVINAAVEMVRDKRSEFAVHNPRISNEVDACCFTFTRSPHQVAQVEIHCIFSDDKKWLRASIKVQRSGRALCLRSQHTGLLLIAGRTSGIYVPELDEEDTVIHYYIRST